MPPVSDLTALVADDLPVNGLATDAQPLLQGWINRAQAQRRPLALPPGLNLRLDASLSIGHGQRAAGDSHRQELILHGNGCTLFPSFAGPALAVVPRCRKAQASTGRGEAQVELRDLGINGSRHPQARAIEWGSAGFQCSNFRYSLIENVLVDGFHQPGAVRFTSCRKILVDRLICRAGAEVRIRCTDRGGFAGDMIFRACELSGSAAVRPLHVFAGNGNRQSQVRGLDFTNCTFYGPGTLLQGSLKAHVADVKFTSCRWDAPAGAPGEHAIELLGQTAGDTLLSKIAVLDPYLVGHKGCALFVHGAGEFRSIKLQGGEIHRVDPQGVAVDAVVLLDGVGGVSIRNVDFFDCSAQALVNAFGGSRPCRDLAIQNNISRAGAVDHLVHLSQHAHDGYIVTGNAGRCTSVVTDRTTGGPSRLVADNLRLTSP